LVVVDGDECHLNGAVEEQKVLTSCSTTSTENPSGAQTSESTKTSCEENVPWSGGTADAATGANTADATTIALSPAARRTQALLHMRSLDIS
jgi:hypothetical protein